MSLLAVEALEVRYGRTRAVQSVSLTLEPGEIVTVHTVRMSACWT